MLQGSGLDSPEIAAENREGHVPPVFAFIEKVLFAWTGGSGSSRARARSRSPPRLQIQLSGLRRLASRPAWQKPTLAHEYLVQMRDWHRRDPVQEDERIWCPSLFDPTFLEQAKHSSAATATGSVQAGQPKLPPVSKPVGPPLPPKPKVPLGINPPPPPVVKVQAPNVTPPPAPVKAAAQAEAKRPRGNRGGKNLEYWKQYYAGAKSTKALCPLFAAIAHGIHVLLIRFASICSAAQRNILQTCCSPVVIQFPVNLRALFEVNLKKSTGS